MGGWASSLKIHTEACPPSFWSIKRMKNTQYEVKAEFPVEKGVFNPPRIFICFPKTMSKPFVVKGDGKVCKKFLTSYNERLLVHEINTVGNQLHSLYLIGQGSNFSLHAQKICVFDSPLSYYPRYCEGKHIQIVSNISSSAKMRVKQFHQGIMRQGPFLKGHRCYTSVGNGVAIHLHFRTTPRGWRPEFDVLWDGVCLIYTSGS